MKRTIKLAVVAALALGATSAFATNGSQLIGIGAKARGMGGTGIGVGHGAESGLSNPALITTIKGDNEISFGGTLFLADVDVQASTLNLRSPAPGDRITSDDDTSVIPAVSLASKINDNWYWGIGMWGTGGLGVDYRGEENDTFNMVTALQTMQFGVPVAYTSNGFSLGITPIIQYTALDIQYDQPMAFRDTTGFGGYNNMDGSIGSGVAQDLAYGFNIGAAYEMSGFTVGAVYKSKIKFDVKDVMNNALNGFGVGPSNTRMGTSIDEMATPEEYGFGISYATSGHTIAVDYKNINWEDAEGYKDFGWEDQDIIAIGYEYATNDWAVRCGYQYAESAVQDNSGKGLAVDVAHQANLTGYGMGAIAGGASLSNTFNLLGFPGTEESHITLGGSYAFNETISMDLAAVYGLENKETYKGFTGEDIESTHSEQSYTIQLNYAF